LGKAAEKLKSSLFRGMFLAEESLFLLRLKAREIPHFVRNDTFERFPALFCGECGCKPKMPIPNFQVAALYTDSRIEKLELRGAKRGMAGRGKQPGPRLLKSIRNQK
jgi:hypothetical protein